MSYAINVNGITHRVDVDDDTPFSGCCATSLV